MKIFLRLMFGFVLLQLAVDAQSQCNSNPAVSNTTSESNITTSTATLHGNVTSEGATGNCSVTETGAKWSLTSNSGYTTQAGNDDGAGPFDVNVNGLPPGSQIFYRLYATNGNGTDNSPESSFYTLATAPAAHAGNLTATTVNNDQILLQFPAANSIPNAAGYIILARAGSAVTTGNLDDGNVPSNATYYLHDISNTSDVSHTVTNLLPNTTYHFTIIPYNRASHDDTYNYLTSAGYPAANATTSADVDIDAEAGGLAGSPLNGGVVDRALVGFSFDASGPVQFQSVVIHLSSTTTGKLSDFTLWESSNDNFNAGFDTPLTSNVSLTVTDTDITISLAEDLIGSSDRFFFLVADVDISVNTNTPAVEFSYDENDFTFNPQYIDGTVSQTRNYAFADVTPPSLVSTSPADDATGVDFNSDKLTLTFNENVENIETGATLDAHRVIIYNAATDIAVATIDRVDVNADGSPVVEVGFPVGSLQPNSDYYVLIGNAVLEDIPADHDWAGISDPTVWNFSTSGVVVNNAASSICSGSFQSIGDIIISEEAAGDFITDGTINLDFANADFGYDISSVTVTAGPVDNTDIATIKLDPKTLTRLTLDYTLDGTNDQVDVITISGLKVYASSPGATTIVNGSSIAGIWAADAPITFATINVGTTTPAAPVLEAMQDLLICQNEAIYNATVSVVDEGGSYVWYNNAALSVQMASGSEVNIKHDLGIDSSVVGTVKRYVVRVDGCQSASLEVSFQVAPIPVADAGPATGTICSGTSLTLGGAPTLIGPSVPGGYQYLWTTNPLNGFTDMGPNPVVSPASDKDTTFHYTVKIVDANNCTSDILDPNATIVVAVDSTDESIIYNSPLSTSFTLNSDPIELNATPSNSSTYSGSGVYLSGGKYYFDPDLAGTTGSPHAVTYSTNLSNGCRVTEVRNFAVSNASGSIINLAGSYCANEAADPSKVLSLGPDWQAQLESDNNKYYAPNGYTYEFYDFQALTSSRTVGPGVVGNVALGQSQYINPGALQPYQPGSPYTYIGMRVRRHVREVRGLLGIILVPESWDPPIFWRDQYVNLFTMPAMKVTGIRPGQVVCDVDESYELEAVDLTVGSYEISRDGINYFTGASVGISDSPPNSGKGIFNPHLAYTSNGFGLPPASGITNFYIRFTYVVPGTIGSNSSACEATLVIPFQISPNPQVSWMPLPETEFCYEAAAIAIRTNPNSTPPQEISISGYGITDNGNGTALFQPGKGLEQKAFGTNSPPYTDYNVPQDIVISAVRKDVNGCATSIQQTVQVRPLFPASFTESDLEVCYEDGPQNIVGDQPNGAYTLTHPNVSVNFAQTTINNFNLRTHFDNAVANGANGTLAQKFNLTFNTFDPALGCANSVTKTFTVNAPLEMNIVGLEPGMIVCGNGTPLSLTGNRTGAGSFEISDTSPTSGFLNEAFGLDNTSSGYAVFTPSGAGLSPGALQKSYYIRYSFLGAGCVLPAQTTEEVIINPQPEIAFSSSNPIADTQYCYEQGSSPTTVSLATLPTSNVVLSGFGITDNGSGEAVFNPTAAYQQSSLAENKNPQTDQTTRHIQVTATRSDAFGCSNAATVSYIVNPLPEATFTPPRIEYCYEDDAVTLTGVEPNSTFQFIYKNTTPQNYSPPPVAGPTTPFDPSAFFDDAVSRGANSLATLQFDVIFTATSSTTGCTNQLAAQTLSVAPYLPGEMAGIEDGETFCSNQPDKEIICTPPNGTFRIDGGLENLDDGKFVFNPPIALPASGRQYVFTYSVTTGANCTNTQTKTVRVLPSPRAIFDVDPQCDTALIAYDAEASTNLASAVYTWNFSGEIKTGQNVEHRFPGVSSYYAKLKVEHPPFQVDPNTTLVCSDSLQLDQFVGPYPRDIRFEFFDVCEGDSTGFEVTSSVPINRVSWDFGDGESTPFGILSENITGLAKTAGTYQKPIHNFSAASESLTVRVLGKTAEDFGGCPSAYQTQISILKKWAPTAAEPSYDMAMLDNGKGYWVTEDKQGNATWEFNAARKQTINTNEMAWVTGAVVPYNGNDVSYVNSPCFDLSSLSRPVISIQHWTDTEPSDGAVLQYSVDGGNTWERLGEVATGLDWYNRLTISSNPGEQDDLSSGWSLSSQEEWAVGKHTLDVLPPQRKKVRLRVAFASFNNREQRDGFAFNNVVIEERNRTILVENFTTLNAPQEPNNRAYNNFRAIDKIFNPAELVKLQYHHSPAQNNLPPDELNLDNPADPNARAAFYGITTPVRAFVDGGFGQSSSNATFQSPALDPYFGLRSLVTSPVTIEIDFENEPSDKLNVKATVSAIDDLRGTGQYNVFVAIAEQQVITGDQDTALYVLRKFLPDPSGTPLTSLSTTDLPQEIDVSYDMRHVTRLADGSFAPFAVIVFVQNLQTKDVLQTVMRHDGNAPSQVVTGIETPFDNYIKIYPNPADDVLNIVLPAPVGAETPLRIFDSFGREVYSGAIKKGQHIKAIETKPFAGGIYLIQLSTPQGDLRKKAMVVHQ